MSTKNDFLAYWCGRTGEPVAEARLRIRALALDGLMPWRQQPFDYIHLANGLIGFAASVTHRDAAVTVRRFGEFPCTRAARHGEHELPLYGKSLRDALVAAFMPPFWIRDLEVNVTIEWVRLTIEPRPDPQKLGWVSAETQRTAPPTPGSSVYWFSDPAALPLPSNIHPVEVSRTIQRPLIDRLLVDLMHHRWPPDPGDAYPVTKNAAPSPKGTASIEPRDHACADARSLTNTELNTRVRERPMATMRSPPPCPPTTMPMSSA